MGGLFTLNTPDLRGSSHTIINLLQLGMVLTLRDEKSQEMNARGPTDDSS